MTRPRPARRQHPYACRHRDRILSPRCERRGPLRAPDRPAPRRSRSPPARRRPRPVPRHRPRHGRPLSGRPGPLPPAPRLPAGPRRPPQPAPGRGPGEHRPDVVHLASPFVLGARGMAAAARLGLPAVAVYQTDLAGYARTYMGAGEAAAWRRIRAVHAAADRTLAPSTAALGDLETHGVPRVRLWPRGVDTVRFRPDRRDEALRRELAPGGELLVGYVGRLAPEKHVELLAGVTALDGVRLVVVGDGPSHAHLTEALPGAAFLGRRTGDELARIFASLDVFAHTGPFETFCQTVQEAMASGVPVVAPAVGGPLDLVHHGRTGLLVPPRDAEAVRDAVRCLAEDPARRGAFGAAARALVEGRTWAAVGDRLIGHYEDVLAGRRTAVAA
ncbi:glycosyltransferase [Streptomyces sp. HF10]|uniref:glycosyltransferase n=1 Tax=Streptomyces sp. HF10 TaxID=2692233 RepID=UPI0022A81CA9|nr:glycosyltransferase [Streptomyces sp. HF10]